MSGDLRLRPVFVVIISILIFSCNQFTYTPRSKNKVRQAKPSLNLLQSIVDYRIDQYGWPVSKEDFVNKGKKYHDAFNNFNYKYITFKIVDSNTMTFYFSGHIYDTELNDKTGLTELNAYAGHVKFFKVKDKFGWRVKMY